MVFISRASEGALNPEWIMQQPIFIRRKYVEDFDKELQERKQKIEQQTKKH